MNPPFAPGKLDAPYGASGHRDVLAPIVLLFARLGRPDLCRMTHLAVNP